MWVPLEGRTEWYREGNIALYVARLFWEVAAMMCLRSSGRAVVQQEENGCFQTPGLGFYLQV